MEKGKKMDRMDDSKLATELYFEPEKFDEIIEMLKSKGEISRLADVVGIYRGELRMPDTGNVDRQKLINIIIKIEEYREKEANKVNRDKKNDDTKEIKIIKRESLEGMDDSKLATELYFEPERFDEMIEMLKSKGEISRLADIAEIYRGELEIKGVESYMDTKTIRKLLSIIDNYLLMEEMRKKYNDLQEVTTAEGATNERAVSISEIKEVAEGQRIENKNETMNAFTSPEEEKIQEGQSHDDE